MKYYKINPKTYNNNGMISSSASVDNLPGIEKELEKIRYGELFK